VPDQGIPGSAGDTANADDERKAGGPTRPGTRTTAAIVLLGFPSRPSAAMESVKKDASTPGRSHACNSADGHLGQAALSATTSSRQPPRSASGPRDAFW